MRLAFTERAWREYLFWQEDDPKTVAKIDALLKECSRTPFHGTGKPERLRDSLAGWWSRRITREHRLVYKVEEDTLVALQCRFHY